MSVRSDLSRRRHMKWQRNETSACLCITIRFVRILHVQGFYMENMEVRLDDNFLCHPGTCWAWYGNHISLSPESRYLEVVQAGE